MSYKHEEYYSLYTIPTMTVKIHTDQSLTDTILNARALPSFTSQYIVYNFLDRPVMIGTGDGMRYILESQIPPNGYIGKNLYIVKRSLFNELKATYTTDSTIDSNNPDTELLLSLFQNKHLPNNRPYTLESIYAGLNRKAEIIYELTPDDLRRYPLVFLRNIDMVISINPRDFGREWIHPNTNRGNNMIEKFKKLVDSDPANDFVLSVRIVNNGRIRVPRYVYAAGTIFQVPEVRDPSRMDGIYIGYNNHVAGDFTESRLDNEERFYTFGDTNCPCRFYYTYKEATELGTPEALMKQKQLKQEEELLRLKHESSVKQLDQKDRIEWIKYAMAVAPVALAAIGSMFQYLLKQKT